MRLGFWTSIVFWCAGSGLLFVLTGCGSTAGWRVSFGVAPVTSISDHAALAEDERPAAEPKAGKRY